VLLLVAVLLLLLRLLLGLFENGCFKGHAFLTDALLLVFLCRLPLANVHCIQ